VVFVPAWSAVRDLVLTHNPNMTMSRWVTEEYPTLPRGVSMLQECVIETGDAHFPSRWMHATLNLDPYNVFVSLFLDPKLMK
jgi:hypothetical protein